MSKSKNKYAIIIPILLFHVLKLSMGLRLPYHNCALVSRQFSLFDKSSRRSRSYDYTPKAADSFKLTDMNEYSSEVELPDIGLMQVADREHPPALVLNVKLYRVQIINN